MQVTKVVPRLGIYQNTTRTKVNNSEIKCDYGVYKKNNIEIYSEYDDGTLTSKLYYVFDDIGNRIQSKLIQFKDGKRIVRNENQLLK